MENVGSDKFNVVVAMSLASKRRFIIVRALRGFVTEYNFTADKTLQTQNFPPVERFLRRKVQILRTVQCFQQEGE